MTTLLDHAKELAERKAVVAQYISKNNEEGLWDSFHAKDVQPEILEEVQYLITLGHTPAEVRRALNLGSSTGQAWRKISAALKMGYRVDTGAWFARIMGRNEKIGDKLYKILDKVLDEDVEKLMEPDEKGVPLLALYSKHATQMIDAMNRLQQGTVTIGKGIGIFQDSQQAAAGSSGVTIVVQNNVPLPTPEEYLRSKLKPDIEVKNESPESEA